MGEALAVEMDDPVHILLVDDDALFVESLERNLVSSGYVVSHFSDGEEALDFLSGRLDVDLVLLDWKMPGMNGIEVLRRLRSAWPELPVIFLTVLGEQIYEEAALIGGAVDYVEKARSYSILRKRIELVLENRMEAAPDGREGAPAGREEGSDVREHDTLTLGDLTLNLDTRRAFWKNSQVDLTLTEFRLVHCLSSREGADVAYRDLYDLVHRDGFVAGYGDDGYRTNVRSFIKRIRQKFREIDSGFDRIENYPAFGYRWRVDTVDEA